jgi:hypothetical protein
MRRTWMQLAYPCLVVLAAALALAFSGGPPASETGALGVGGAPAEDNCSLCHSTNPVNDGGSLTIAGVPSVYVPGNTYLLTLTLASSRTTAPSTRWGFELTAVRGDNGQGVGTFATVGTGTRIINGAGAFATRRYVQHTSTGLREGQGSPQSWQMNWTAPAAGQDHPKIYFFAAGNAANRSFTNTGDWIYTTIESTSVDVTPVRPESWGSIKARYR